MNDFLELAKSRYSVRRYKADPVPDEILAKILDAGHLAPTACNYQPQRIWVIRDAALRAAMKEATPHTFDAPVILAVGYDKGISWKNDLMPVQSGETDAAIVLTHMMLEAWELGIGSCWVGHFNGEKAAELLGLPENIVLTALLPMGYPAEEAHPAHLHGKFRDAAEIVEYR